MPLQRPRALPATTFYLSLFPYWFVPATAALEKPGHILGRGGGGIVNNHCEFHFPIKNNYTSIYWLP